MNELAEEIARNLTGYVLLFVGFGVVGVGTRYNIPKLSETGTALISASLLALSARPGPQSPPPPPPAAAQTESSPK